MNKIFALVLLLGGCASSGPSVAWVIDDRYGEHVVDGYVGYMRDDKPEKTGSLHAVLQKSGDGSVGLSVGAWGCAEEHGEFFDGTEWNGRSPSERVAAVKRAFRDSAERVANLCQADLNSLDAQTQQLDSAFADLDSHPRR